MPEFSPQQRAFIRKHSKYEEPGADELDDELNIIPFLDIVVNLIMFLLMITSSIAFYSQVEASLPTYSSGGVGRRSTDEPQLNLSVFVTQNGITVTGSGGKLAPGCATTSTGDVMTVAKRGGTYNWDGLRDCVATVKEEFPDETRVTVSADNLVEFQDLISAMDAVRTKDGEELFPEVLISAGVR